MSYIFSWMPISSMKEKRYYGASALDKNGDLWMIGGNNGESETSKETELYRLSVEGRFLQQLNSNHWKNGYPLPEELKLSGIESQCVVTYVCLISFKKVHKRRHSLNPSIS